MKLNPIAQAVREPRREPRTLKLSICVPSHDGWKADFGLSLARMCLHLSTTPIPGYRASVNLIDSRGSMLPAQRQSLLEEAIDGGATHALFLDSDMQFPADTIHRLVKHERGIVAVNCSMKKTPPESTAGVLVNGRRVAMPTAHDHTGLTEVETAGTGIMLIDLSILKDIPKPWFLFEYDGEGDFIAEDYYFCLKAKEAGHKTYVDLDLSREIGHIGSYTYTLDPTPAKG